MSKNSIIIKGDTIEDKFSHIEIMLNRIQRRMNEKIVGVISPSAIYHHVEKPDKDGIILKK